MAGEGRRDGPWAGIQIQGRRTEYQWGEQKVKGRRRTGVGENKLNKQSHAIWGRSERGLPRWIIE